MIKFFRKIRQRTVAPNGINDMIKENPPAGADRAGRASKYVLYALGEIILVMIGILLALQVNNWNNEKKDRHKEQLLLEQLKEEYTSNLAQLDRKIEMRTRIIRSSKKLLSYIDTPEFVPSDSILKYLGPSGAGPTFDPITNDLISAGKLSLIQNEKLKKRLSAWTSELVQITEEEQTWVYFKRTIRTPYLVKQHLIRDISNELWKGNDLDIIFINQPKGYQMEVGRSKRNVDLTKLLSDPEFESIISYGLGRNKTTNVQSYGLRDRILEILNEIDDSLIVRK